MAILEQSYVLDKVLDHLRDWKDIVSLNMVLAHKPWFDDAVKPFLDDAKRRFMVVNIIKLPYRSLTIIPGTMLLRSYEDLDLSPVERLYQHVDFLKLVHKKFLGILATKVRELCTDPMVYPRVYRLQEKMKFIQI